MGQVGGWSDKTKLILISTLVEVVVEVEVELGNRGRNQDIHVQNLPPTKNQL